MQWKLLFQLSSGWLIKRLLIAVLEHTCVTLGPLQVTMAHVRHPKVQLSVTVRVMLSGVWREGAESCCVWGCVKAPRGSSGVHKGFRWEQFLMVSHLSALPLPD